MAPSIDISAGFHRFRPDEEWLYAQSTAMSADNGIIGGEGRVLGARRDVARGRREPIALPSGTADAAVGSAPWRTGSRRGSTSR